MVEEERDNVNLVRISNEDEQYPRHSRAILETSPSIISFESSNIPPSVFDVLNEIYSDRTHRKCVTISYFTLLSMSLSVIFWICYWLAYNRCQNLEDPESNSFLCDLVTIFETLTFVSLSIIPFLFLYMIYSWINYFCYNPMDSIRKNCKDFKLEGDQWKKQLNYYYNKQKIKYLNCFHYKQKKELYERGYGYIILSSFGIVIDELIILSNRKNLIDNAILLEDNKLLKLIFKRTFTRPWKIHILVYLPEHTIHQRDLEQLQKLFHIQNTNDSISPSST